MLATINNLRVQRVGIIPALVKPTAEIASLMRVEARSVSGVVESLGGPSLVEMAANGTWKMGVANTTVDRNYTVGTAFDSFTSILEGTGTNSAPLTIVKW